MASVPTLELAPTLNSELYARLRERVEDTVLYLIKTNRLTRYVRESPVLRDFRDALDALGDPTRVQDASLLECFRTTVPLSGYDAYEPFLNQFSNPSAREKDIRDIFAPGLPYFLACSSATSGKKPKLFAKYRHAIRAPSNPVDDNIIPIAASQRGKNCFIVTLTYKSVIKVVDDEDTTVAHIPITPLSGGMTRMRYGFDIDKDSYNMNVTIPQATSPTAIGFIINYRSFLLMHVLFALADPELESIITLFGTVFIDMMRFLEEEWDALIRSVETGVIPDWEGTDHVRQYLEPRFSANPERAAYLRNIGKATDQPGWIKQLWPQINIVIGVASGVFSFVIPKMKHYLGSDVQMWSLGFAASEALVGYGYSQTDINLFKATNDDIIEYLDFSKGDTESNLHFAHEVEAGHRYEVVVTTRDGLWRYRLGDVVEIVGFDQTDGTPIFRYIERRGAFIRIPGVLISEKQLSNAISSTRDVLGTVTEFTAFMDDRRSPLSLAVLVEIDGELSDTAHEAPARIEVDLCRSNENVLKVINDGRLGPPTVYVLKQGTFSEYRASRIKAANTGVGQIKLPAVMLDKATQEWMLGRVERVIVRASVTEVDK